MGVVVSEQELVAAVARERAAGRTVAFANGCFDLLHVGHVRYLQGAAAEADRLVVAINSDRSVRGLKAENHTILPDSARPELANHLRGTTNAVMSDKPDLTRPPPPPQP